MNFIFQCCRRQSVKSLALASLMALAFCVSAPAQERPTEYQIKAAFLEKFGKFVEWPDDALANSNSPFVIGVFREDPFQEILEGLAAKDTIQGHAIEVRLVKALPDLKGCNILFIPASEKPQERDVLNAVNGLSILTVGDSDGFCGEGGMIQFIIENNQVHFAINNEAARATGLKISSKLLILAQPLKK
ncbi:MAG TPA: YfiR family protein [Methylomirabilota bacterium]|nr:YfiR family protein [Methylomirabilota bacterium]